MLQKINMVSMDSGNVHGNTRHTMKKAFKMAAQPAKKIRGNEPGMFMKTKENALERTQEKCREPGMS